MRRSAALVAAGVLMLAACGDDGDDVDSGTDDDGVEVPAAIFVGVITQVMPFEPVTEDCTPPDELDPDGSVSSDDPPVCTDPDTAPLGTILVEVEPGIDSGEKIVFTVLQETVLSSDGAAIGFDDLVSGQEAEVGYSGTVAESYPGQATADSVEVTPPA